MLEKVTNSCKFVMDKSQSVKINYAKLDDFILKIECANLQNWLLSNPYQLLDMNTQDIINFLVYFEAIDYSFWGNPKWMIQTPDGDKDGSDALLYALLNYFKENKSFANLTLDTFKKIVSGNVDIPLLEERYETLKLVNDIVLKRMNGNFYEFIKDVTVDTELFEIIITNFTPFKDERTYNGKTIYFYKLAQLLTSDILHIREKLEKKNVDYTHLIGCADYKIPQVLRALGIIEYDSKLENIIDSNTPLEKNSKYEVEIRASQIVVLDYICKKIPGVTSIDVNDYLFIYSKKIKDLVKPYHKCRNTNY